MSRRLWDSEVDIGDADGRIALWLTEQSALDLASCLAHDDLGYAELMEAVERAYPAPAAAAPGENEE